MTRAGARRIRFVDGRYSIEQYRGDEPTDVLQRAVMWPNWGWHPWCPETFGSQFEAERWIDDRENPKIVKEYP